MNPGDPLAALHPLREPPPIGWWPPAPGWWVLFALIIAGLLAAVWLLLRRYRANAYRRIALGQLQALREQRLQQDDSQEYLAAVNALLKSVALHAWPRDRVAASNGETWLAFLNSGMPEGERFDPAFVTALYRKECPSIDLDALHTSAATWIRHHRGAAA